MSHNPVILLAEDHAALIPTLAAARPDWRVAAMAGPLPPLATAAPVWAFIDWLGADMAGAERCRRLRTTWPALNAHVTMVLDGHDPDDRRRALAAGADDYLIGPLDAARIAARVDQCRQGAPMPRAHLGFDDVVIDTDAHRVVHAGHMIALRPNEFRLLVHFVENPDRVFSRAALIERLGKHGAGVDERTVDVWIGRLRRTLIAHGTRDPLRTVRSYGYVFDSIADASATPRRAAG